MTDPATELAELRSLFDMTYRSDMRAIARWQEAHPGWVSVWPDRTDLVVWLMEQHEQATATVRVRLSPEPTEQQITASFKSARLTEFHRRMVICLQILDAIDYTTDDMIKSAVAEALVAP